jgi:23S rRNA pseudouridine1911/1915/1917 synthase
VLTADADAAGQRLDQWLATALGERSLSRSRIQALIKEGRRHRRRPPSEPKRKIAAGEEIAHRPAGARTRRAEGEDIPLNILFEDEHLIVIDKPAGLVVHPGAGNWTGTLVNALIHHCGDSLSGIGGVKRPGIVHRLDKDTSGVMVVAKTDLAHRALSEAFADHGRDRRSGARLSALVWGAPPRAGRHIDAPLGRAADRVRRAVVPAGARRRPPCGDALRGAGTLWRGQSDIAQASLVECRLETGRTHQIRVHMAHIGHPVIGDRDYGAGFRTKANRLPEPLKGLVQSPFRARRCMPACWRSAIRRRAS